MKPVCSSVSLLLYVLCDANLTVQVLVGGWCSSLLPVDDWLRLWATPYLTDKLDNAKLKQSQSIICVWLFGVLGTHDAS